MVSLVIPALNEAEVIREVIRSVPTNVVNLIIVVDNGSTDATAQTAAEAGATVVSQPVRGYGRACRAGMGAAIAAGADIVVFIDGDGSDCPEFMDDLVRPIRENRFDFVMGSRTRGTREKGSLNMRGGVSKVSGTFSGTIRAAFRIAATFVRVAFIRNRIFVE
jgi:glycosyltransferase involved in cell wall biosynthesis